MAVALLLWLWPPAMAVAIMAIGYEKLAIFMIMPMVYGYISTTNIS
jgi:hypothetical protein